jgi:surface antigen
MFNKLRKLSLVALGALAIGLFPLGASADRGDHDGGKRRWQESGDHKNRGNYRFGRRGDRQVYKWRGYRRAYGWRRHHHRRWRKQYRPRWAPGYGHRRDRYAGAASSTSFPVNLGGGGDRTFLGGLIGAVLGATVGSQIGKGSGNTAAIVGGGVLGALVGGNIGRGMDRVDRAATSRALETSPTGNTVAWRNPSTGTSYRVTPVRTYQTPDNRVCRDFSSWAVIDGYEEKIQGTACRMPDGSWKRAG